MVRSYMPIRSRCWPGLAVRALGGRGQAPRPGHRRGALRPSPKGMPVMVKSSATSLILAGVLAVIAGIIAIAWPGITVLALVIVFAIDAFIAAGLQAARA